MRRMIVLMLVAIVTSGCVATQRTPPEAVVSRLRAIAIVAVETSPLLLHPKTEAERTAIAAVGVTSPGGSPAGFSGTNVILPLPLFRVVGVAQVGAIIARLGESSTPRAGETATMTSDRPPAWMQSPGLSRIAAQLLQRAGTQEVFVVEGYAKLPIEDRSVNVVMENWMAPIRRWYNSDVSMLDETQLGARRVDAILEVGVSNYELIWDILVLQVHVKLSDPTTKQVLGRARNYAAPETKPLAQMLQDNGEPLRRLIETTGEALLAQCLKDLGLISH